MRGCNLQDTPFSEPLRGRAAIREYWAEKVTRSQEQVSFGYEILAAAGDRVDRALVGVLLCAFG